MLFEKYKELTPVALVEVCISHAPGSVAVGTFVPLSPPDMPNPTVPQSLPNVAPGDAW